jgi:hypothetical protein
MDRLYERKSFVSASALKQSRPEYTNRNATLGSRVLVLFRLKIFSVDLVWIISPSCAVLSTLLCTSPLPRSLVQSHGSRSSLWFSLAKISMNGFNFGPCLLRPSCSLFKSEEQDICRNSPLERTISSSSSSESPLMELHVENVQLQDKQYWMLVVDGLDPKFLETFSLCYSSHSQFVACANAMDVFALHFAAT